MKALIFPISLMVFFSGISYAQEPEVEKNYIYWTDQYRLVWTDFDELPQRYSEHSAFSVVGYESAFEMNDHHYKANIKTYFDKKNSWARDWVPILLKHEQGHFDLAEVHARKFRKQLKDSLKSGNISIERFERMNVDAMEQLKIAQKEYDEATNYSMDYRAQLRWTLFITEELKKLEAFANTELIVSRSTN